MNDPMKISHLGRYLRRVDNDTQNYIDGRGEFDSKAQEMFDKHLKTLRENMNTDFQAWCSKIWYMDMKFFNFLKSQTLVKKGRKKFSPHKENK